MTCGCSSEKKKLYNNHLPMMENYQISPCLKKITREYDNCSEHKKEQSCFKNGVKDYKKECKNNGDGVNFIYSEPGYRQATKCPCPYEYPSQHCPKIPFI